MKEKRNIKLSTIIIVISSIISILFTIAMFSKISNTSLYTTYSWEEAKEDDQIAIIPLRGVINSQMADNTIKLLSDLEKDESIKGIILRIDSPGGGVTATDRIYNKIQRVKASKDIPVYAVMETLAASGGYYAACSADHITASSTTITGSIGVIMQTPNYSKAVDKLGIEFVTITSGEMKSLLSPSQPIKEKHISLLQDIIDENYTIFLEKVKNARFKNKELPTKNGESFVDGRVFSGSTAVKFGFADNIGYMEDSINLMKSKLGTQNINVVEYKKSQSLFNAINSNSDIGKSLARNIIDPYALEPNQLYYILK